MGRLTGFDEMSKDLQKKEYWFPAKKYGYGWGLPVNWQGRVVMALYLGLITAGIFLFPLNSEAGLLQYIVFAVVLTAGFIAVCWYKGEPARWRWGDEDS